VGIHPPKTETFDVAAGTNTDPKGFVRAVDVYREAPHGLYLSRPMPGHPTLTHLRSWLLPALGLRVTDFSWKPGHERLQDHYLDVVDITRDGATWRTEDHYVDLVVRTGERTDVLDLDELAEAVAAGLLDPGRAERALTTSHRTLAGLAGHGHDLEAWLATFEVVLEWV
jgi:predicted RNA-binding protein associated with RNAse of E/G family